MLTTNSPSSLPFFTAHEREETLALPPLEPCSSAAAAATLRAAAVCKRVAIAGEHRVKRWLVAENSCAAIEPRRTTKRWSVSKLLSGRAGQPARQRQRPRMNKRTWRNFVVVPPPSVADCKSRVKFGWFVVNASESEWVKWSMSLVSTRMPVGCWFFYYWRQRRVAAIAVDACWCLHQKTEQQNSSLEDRDPVGSGVQTLLCLMWAEIGGER